MSVALGLLLSGFNAWAGSVDVFGFGAASIGRGQGGVAIADGGMTVFRNPALLQNLSMAEAVVGFSVNRGRFPDGPPVYWDTNQDGTIDVNDEGLEVRGEAPHSDGLTLSIGRHVGKKVGLALNAFLPTDQFLRLRTTEPSLPSWVMYGNRTQRFEIGIGLGAELYRGLSLGVGTEMVAKARYQIRGTLDVAVGGLEEGDETPEDLIDQVRVDVHEMTLNLVPRFVPIVGAHWDAGVLVPALEGLSAGVVWRGSSGFPITADIDLQLNGEVSGLGDLESMGVALVMPVELSIYDHYVPERWSFGAAYEFKSTSRVYVDVHHTRWSGMRVNVAHVTESAVRSQLFQVEGDLVEDGNVYKAQFEDTLSVHTGTEVSLPGIETKGQAGTIRPVARAGFAYIPSPLINQGGGTAFLDADRMLFTAGFGVIHGDPFGLVPGDVAWDVFYTRHHLASGELMPVAAEDSIAGMPVDGAPIPVGGALWSFGLQFSVNF